MALNRLLTREQSTDKVTQKNGRWETNDDGINQYVYDETITVSAESRCLGVRSRSAWGRYSGSNQCSSKGSPKWSNGELCKKCSDDVYLNWNAQRHGLLQVVVEQGYEDDFEEIASQAFTDEGIDKEKYPEMAHARYHNAFTKAWVDFGMEALYTKHGIIEPEADSVAVRNEKRKGAREQEKYLIMGADSIVTPINLKSAKTMQAQLAIMLIGEKELPIDVSNLGGRGYYDTNAIFTSRGYTNTNVMNNFASISNEGIIILCPDVTSELSDERKAQMLTHYQEQLDNWRKLRTLGPLSRVTYDDLLDEYNFLEKYITAASLFNASIEVIQDNFRNSHTISNRSWPWQQEEEE